MRTCSETRTNTIYKKSLKIPKGQSESVYRRWTDNTMAKRKSTKGQTTIYKTSSNTNPTKNRGWTQVLWTLVLRIMVVILIEPNQELWALSATYPVLCRRSNSNMYHRPYLQKALHW